MVWRAVHSCSMGLGLGLLRWFMVDADLSVPWTSWGMRLRQSFSRVSA